MRFKALSIVALLSSGAIAAEPTEIPLKDVWAYRMPGTRDIGKLEKGKPPSQEHGRLVGEIRRVLGRTLEKGKVAGPAFAVSGTGINALREAHAVLLEKKTPRDKFASGGDVSVVFFSYSTGAYVQLDKVRRRNQEIEIGYRFHTHPTMELTEHIAIIPLTALEPRTYRVRVIQSPVDKDLAKEGFKFVDPKRAEELVSGSFDFKVEGAM
jgi:hypothetical protein